MTTTDRLVRAATIAVVIAYAWLTSSALEPRFPIPKAMLSGVVWVEGGEVKTYREVKAHRFDEVMKLASGIQRADSALRAIGGLKTPVGLIINVDQPSRYAITEQHIELGTSALSGDGQVEKALMKAWLHQKGQRSIASSLVRLEVASDALVAMLVGRRASIPLPKVDNWLRFASSYQVLCEKPWKTQELQGFCGESESIASLAFRPLMSSMIVSLHDELPPIKRLEFARAWARQLEADPAASEASMGNETLPSRLAEWRQWLDKELKFFVPEELNETFEQLGPFYDLVRAKAGLFPGASAPVSYIFFGEEPAENETSFVGTSLPIVLSETHSSKGALLLPGRARLQPGDLMGLKASWLVWESCQVPSLSDILEARVESARILYLQTCGLSGTEIANARRTLVRGGTEALAKLMPELPFLQMRSDMIELAFKRGGVDRAVPLTSYMEKRTDKAAMLGLDSAQWKDDVRAFRVLGAIELVEWFRAPQRL